MTIHKAPLQLASCISIVVLDILVYAVTMLLHAHGLLGISLSGALLAFVIVSSSESRAGSSLLQALTKGVFGGLAVAVPLPIVGTLLGLAGSLWHWTAERRSARA